MSGDRAGLAAVLLRAGLGFLAAVAAAALVARLVRGRAAREAAASGPPVRAEPPCAAEGAGPPPAGSRCEEVLAFFGDLRPGEALARWTLRTIGPVRQGGILVGLTCQDGTTFDVEVRRRDPAGPAAPAEGGVLAIYLRGVPDGAATPEELGLGAMVLLDALLELGTEPPGWLATYRAGGAGQR